MQPTITFMPHAFAFFIMRRGRCEPACLHQLDVHAVEMADALLNVRLRLAALVGYDG